MMMGHEGFDPETSKKVLVDRAFIVAGGEITKQARNWLGAKLDASTRSQVLFMDCEDILNLYIVNNLPTPARVKIRDRSSASRLTDAGARKMFDLDQEFTPPFTTR